DQVVIQLQKHREDSSLTHPPIPPLPLLSSQKDLAERQTGITPPLPSAPLPFKNRQLSPALSLPPLPSSKGPAERQTGITPPLSSPSLPPSQVKERPSPPSIPLPRYRI